jgi:hypothetical protein
MTLEDIAHELALDSGSADSAAGFSAYRDRVRIALRSQKEQGVDVGIAHGRRMAESKIVVKLQELAADLDALGDDAAIHPERYPTPADGFVSAAEAVRNAIAGIEQ